MEIACRSRHAARHADRAFEQVGSANVSNAKKITGDETDGRVGRRTVGDEKDDVLRSVPRYMQGPKSHVSKIDLVTIAEPTGPWKRRPVISRRARPGSGQEELRARLLRQGDGAGHEIGMQVRFGDHRDPDTLLPRRGQVGLRIIEWINDDRLTRALAGDEVGRLGEAIVVEPTKEHGAR